MIDHVNLSNIEVSLVVNINVAAVVTSDLVYFLTFVNYFALEVFLRLTFYVAYFVVCVDLVLGVVEFYFATNPLIQSSHNCIVVSVSCIVEFTGLSVVENHSFVTGWNYHCRIDIGFYGIFVPTVHDVLFAWTFNIEMRTGRVMASLLKVHVCSISCLGLIGLSQNWIKWLLEMMILPKESNSRSNNTLHAFKWITDTCCIVEVKTKHTLDCGQVLK